MDGIAKKASKFAKAVYNAAAHPEQFGPTQHDPDHPSQQLLQQQQQQQSHLSPYFQQTAYQGNMQQNPSFYAGISSGQPTIPPPYGHPGHTGPIASVSPSNAHSMPPSTGLSPQFSAPSQHMQGFAQYGAPQDQSQGQWAQSPATWPTATSTAMGTSNAPLNTPAMPPQFEQQIVFSQSGFTPGSHAVSPLPPNATPVAPPYFNQVPFSPISPLPSSMNMAPGTIGLPSVVSSTSHPSAVHEIPAQQPTSFVAELPADQHVPVIELPADIPMNFTPSMGQSLPSAHVSSPPPPLLAKSADTSIQKIEQPKPVHPDQTPAATAQQIATMTPVSPPPFSPPIPYQQLGVGNQQAFPNQNSLGLTPQQMHVMAQQQLQMGIPYPTASMQPDPSNFMAGQQIQPSYQPGMYPDMPNGVQAPQNTSEAVIQQQLQRQQQLLLQQRLAAQEAASRMPENRGM